MKIPGKLLLAKQTPLWSFCLVAVIQFFSVAAQAWEYTLEDGNSKVTITADSEDGMKNWCVDGVDQLYKQWFWYRVGSTGRERSINTLGLDNPMQTADNSLYAEYAEDRFRIEASFTLMGGAMGSGESSIGEQIKIKNLTGSPLDFHFFQYTDFDLQGSAPGDTVQLFTDSMGLFTEALQVKGNFRFADTVVSPGANHGEASIAASPNSLNIRLNNSTPTTLNDFAGPLTGDTEWAFQWDKVLAPYASLTIYIVKDSYMVPIPEPGSLSLVAAGLVLFGIVRRSRHVSK
jgi:PEP-CTERM motif-containing protein